MHVFALWFCWFFVLLPVAALNIFVWSEVCFMAVGHHGRSVVGVSDIN
jgi:hypothetical protein